MCFVSNDLLYLRLPKNIGRGSKKTYTDTGTQCGERDSRLHQRIFNQWMPQYCYPSNEDAMRRVAQMHATRYIGDN